MAAVRTTFETHWSNSDEKSAWPIGLQRELILAFDQVADHKEWATKQLHRIEPDMLRGGDPYERVETCEKQARAWLAIGEREAALVQLHRIVQAVRGILSEKDYQLQVWMKWLGLYNTIVPDRADECIRLMLRRLLSVQ